MSAVPKVGFHDFRTYAGHPGRDGANFAYAELGLLLKASDRIAARPHDLLDLCRDDRAARDALAGCDTVLATVGPHAYFYYYLRERLGLRFRIVRDVRTALWNGYLLQESLCAAYLRPEDSLIHSSAYSSALFRRLFPGTPPDSHQVCYPLLRWFPAAAAGTWRGSRPSKTTLIGYVGRLTEDKNFAQALDLLSRLRRRSTDVRLQAVGEAQHPPRARPGFEWVPKVDREELWHRYAAFDVLFFPSTSTLETFGRVLVEASHVGVPILASCHGATTELLDQEALLPTAYHTGRRFTAHLAAPLGEVDIETAVRRLLDGPPVPASTGYTRYRDHPGYLIDILADGNAAGRDRTPSPTPQQAAFVDSVRMQGLDIPATTRNADAVIAVLRDRFVTLHRRGHPRYWLTLADLLYRSRYRAKTAKFAYHSAVHGQDFTNIGGIDLQLSHLPAFYPSFTLAPA